MSHQELYKGDCLEIMPTFDTGMFDLILCDLPYQITSNVWDIQIPFEELWLHYSRVLKPNGVVALTAVQPFTSVAVMSNPKNFRHEWIWIKNAGSNFANTCREPMKEHESVLIFSAGRWTYNKQMQERAESGKARVKTPVKFETSSDNYRQFEGREPITMPELRVPSSWQKFNRERGLHPNQKPVALMEYIIRTYSNEEECVLDNCMGSGTTGVACINTNRNFVGIEKDEKYFEVAKNRIEDAAKSYQARRFA